MFSNSDFVCCSKWVSDWGHSPRDLSLRAYKTFQKVNNLRRKAAPLATFQQNTTMEIFFKIASICKLAYLKKKKTPKNQKGKRQLQFSSYEELRCVRLYEQIKYPMWGVAGYFTWLSVWLRRICPILSTGQIC